METLWGYVIVNKGMTHACVIPKSTRKYWVEVEKYDKLEKEVRKFYACPKTLCTFHPMAPKSGS